MSNEYSFSVVQKVYYSIHEVLFSVLRTTKSGQSKANILTKDWLVKKKCYKKIVSFYNNRNKLMAKKNKKLKKQKLIKKYFSVKNHIIMHNHRKNKKLVHVKKEKNLIIKIAWNWFSNIFEIS